MDRHAATRWHAGLRIAAIRRHAGLRIAGAQDLEEPALRYQVETEMVDVIRGSEPQCWSHAPAVWRTVFPPCGRVRVLRQVLVQGQGRRLQAAAAWRGQYTGCKDGVDCWECYGKLTSTYNGGLVHTEPRAADGHRCMAMCTASGSLPTQCATLQIPNLGCTLAA